MRFQFQSNENSGVTVMPYWRFTEKPSIQAADLDYHYYFSAATEKMSCFINIIASKADKPSVLNK